MTVYIHQFHYLVTAFWLSVWIPVDYVIPWYHAIVWFVLHATQVTIFVIDPDVLPTPSIFWGYGALSTLLGIIMGVVFQWTTKPPKLISSRHGWEATVFVKAPALTALFIGAQVYYGKLPPQDGTAWGIVLTSILTCVVVAVTWVWSYDEPWANDGATVNISSSFIWWIVLQFILTTSFVIGFSSLSEHIVTLIAGGGSLAVFLILRGTVSTLRRSLVHTYV